MEVTKTSIGKPISKPKKRLTIEQIEDFIQKNWVDHPENQRAPFVVSTKDSNDAGSFKFGFAIGKHNNKKVCMCGPVGWCGSDLDNFAFDMSNIRTFNLDKTDEIGEFLRHTLATHLDEDEFINAVEDGLYVL